MSAAPHIETAAADWFALKRSGEKPSGGSSIASRAGLAASRPRRRAMRLVAMRNR